MKVNCKFWFEDDNGKKFFGKGNYLLLKEIDKTKSLNKASKNMKKVCQILPELAII